MILQHLNIGDIVNVPTTCLAGNYNTDAVYGTILFPTTDGKYAIRLKNGYVYAPQDVIHQTRAELRYADYGNSSQIKVIFFGNGQFGADTLSGLIEKGYDVCMVVTSPDIQKGRGGQTKPTPVKNVAQKYGLNIIEPHKLNSQRFLRRVKATQAAIGVVADFKILPKELYSLPKYGTINLHSSLLPRHRGSSTVIAAIKERDLYTGVTAILVNEKVDRGGILCNMGVMISEFDTASTLACKLGKISSDVAQVAIERRMSGKYLLKQDSFNCDILRSSYAPRLSRDDYRINWMDDAVDVIAFIRAHSPKPGAWSELQWIGEAPIEVKITGVESTLIPRGGLAPGELVVGKDEFKVACGDYLVRILYLQVANKRAMTPGDYLRGHRGARKGFFKLITPL